MRSDVKRKLIDTLRSGDIEQGFGALRYWEGGVSNDDGRHCYCVLGVLCLLYNDEIGRDDSEKMTEKEWGEAILPKRIAGWASCEVEPNVIRHGEDRVGLIELNDDEEHSFTQLAEIIEEQL